MNDLDRLQYLLASNPTNLLDLVNDPAEFLDSHEIALTDEILSRIELLQSVATPSAIPLRQSGPRIIPHFPFADVE